MPTVLIPPAFPYSGAFVAFGAACSPPVGKPSWGAFEFDWADVTAATPGFVADFGQFPNMPKQITTCYVDNSRSHQAVTIIFTDDGFKLIVKPFTRGYYQVLTKGTQFYIGIADFFGTSAQFDHTTIGLLDFFVPPHEEEVVLLRNFPILSQFDPAIAAGPTVLKASVNDQFIRLRNGFLQMSDLESAAGFNGTFQLLTDSGLVAVEADLAIFAGGVVDMGYLWQPNGELDVAGTEWQYTWTVNSGALDHAGLANLMLYFDKCGSI